MLCKDIIETIEKTYPQRAALEWDNVGLLVGRSDKEVQKIYVALDATESVICKAAEMGADMLITHHPLIFSPLKQITDEKIPGRCAVTLLQHDISCYAMHTNYDVLRMADLSANMLGLRDCVILEETDRQRQEGIGRAGYLPQKMSLRECCAYVKEAFHLPSVRLFGDPDGQVERAAICPGSGKHMTETAIRSGADVFITGDIDHHEGIDAVAMGIAIIDAGHYGLEHIFIRDVSEFLKACFEEVEVESAPICHPFHVI